MLNPEKREYPGHSSGGGEKSRRKIRAEAGSFKYRTINAGKAKNYSEAVKCGAKAGELFLEIERFEEAADMFNGASITSAAHLKKDLEDFERAVEYGAKAGEAYLKAKMPKEAAKSFLAVSHISAAQLKDFERAIEYRTQAGEAYVNAKMLEEAAKAFEVAAEMSATQLKDFERAIEYREKAAEAYSKVNNFEKAQEMLQWAAEHARYLGDNKRASQYAKKANEVYETGLFEKLKKEGVNWEEQFTKVYKGTTEADLDSLGEKVRVMAMAPEQIAKTLGSMPADRCATLWKWLEKRYLTPATGFSIVMFSKRENISIKSIIRWTTEYMQNSKDALEDKEMSRLLLGRIFVKRGGSIYVLLEFENGQRQEKLVNEIKDLEHLYLVLENTTTGLADKILNEMLSIPITRSKAIRTINRLAEAGNADVVSAINVKFYPKVPALLSGIILNSRLGAEIQKRAAKEFIERLGNEYYFGELRRNLELEQALSQYQSDQLKAKLTSLQKREAILREAKELGTLVMPKDPEAKLLKLTKEKPVGWESELSSLLVEHGINEKEVNEIIDRLERGKIFIGDLKDWLRKHLKSSPKEMDSSDRKANGNPGLRDGRKAM